MKKNKEKVPKIRFPGFTEPWEQRKLNEIAYVLDGDRGNNYPNRNEFQKIGHTLFLSASNVTTNGFMLDDTQYITEEKSNSMGNGKLLLDDIVLTSRGSIGHIAWYNKDIQQQIPFARINSGMLILRSKDFVIPCFVSQFLKSPLGKKQIDLISFGSAQPQLTKKDISNYVVSIPSDSNEQIKVGIFFDSLDNLITLHQRKLNHLKDKKKGLLQKMFPKNGELVPELRFPEFTDPWEQRKLGELLISSDKRNNEGKYTQDDILAASLGTELVKKHIFFGLRSTEESVKNYRVVNSGDVIYTKSPIKGYPNGIIRTNKGVEGIVPSLYCVYHSIVSINSSYIQSYFEDKCRLDAYLYPMVNIGARNNVNITDLGFLEGTICIPQNIEEQNKIVDFFNRLTNLITLHQRKLDHLKEQKKALLQQMFI